MGFWQRLFGRGREEERPSDGFVSRVVRMPAVPATHRLAIAEYPTFHSSLRVALLRNGVAAAAIPDRLRGHLVGVCPSCGVRLSYEYLEWLSASSGPTGPQAARWVRFALGKCVNKGCEATELLLYWQPA